MAEAILFSIAGSLVDRIGQNLVDLFKGSNLKDILERLSHKMNNVKALSDKIDIEGKQINDNRAYEWIDKVKSTMYDADDLVDEIGYNALESAGSQIFLSRKIKENLEAVLKRFDDLEVEAGQILGLGEEHPSLVSTPYLGFIEPSVIYGRNDDKEAMIQLLLSSKENDAVGLIPIVGTAGVGKTTLAMLLYDDERVQRHFHVRDWIPISQTYDVGRVARYIIRRFAWEPEHHFDNGRVAQFIISQEHGDGGLEVLRIKLREVLTGKRFFFVLDDVWNNDQDWHILLLLLTVGVGAKGSKIIVTTSNPTLAMECTTGPVHHLQELTDEDCWSLFSHHAFDGVDFTACDPDLEDVGRVIAKKCKGLPLSARLLGSFLGTHRSAQQWRTLLNANIWESEVGQNIFHFLNQSYKLLPPHLRSCFDYCAIFPKGYEFRKEDLILFWMAEGLLVQLEGHKDVQEVGDEYFQLLLSRSFFQQSSVNPSYFIIHDLMRDFMHDFMHDLARNVARSGGFLFDAAGRISFGHSELARDVSYSHKSDAKYEYYDPHQAYEYISQVEVSKSLRTFFSVKQPNQMHHSKRIQLLLPRFRRLRLLSLSGYDGFYELHDSIDTLKHLRFMNISEMSITKLPSNLCKLYYLQTLILYGCKYLTELPANFGNLINLYHLDIRGTKLQWMPSAMGKLTKLQKLSDFVIGYQKGASIKELGMLQHLQGELSIRNLQNVLDARDALEANLKGKQLKELKLRWDENTQGPYLENVLEQLQPNVNVEHLLIAGYGGEKFPGWVRDSSVLNIVSLKLNKCKYCSSIPPLGQLESLQELWIAEFDCIVDVDSGFYGTKPFRSLKILRFERMPLWREWVSCPDEDGNGAFPVLQELYIHDCPSLEKSLPSHVPCLTTLDIEGCQKLVVDVLPSASSVMKFVLKDNSRLLQLQELPSGMHLLRVDKFGDLEFILERGQQAIDLSATLEAIQISRCHSLKFFPLEYFPTLKRFDIYGCPNLESLFVPENLPEDLKDNLSESPAQFPLVQELRIRECPKLTKALPSSLPSLTTLEIEGCQQLAMASIPKAPAIVRMLLVNDTCRVLLENSMYEISNWDLLESFPLEMFPKLHSLQIISCANLKSLCLSEGPLGDFSSLKRMEIWECHNLESFPGGLAASNLEVLSLRCCSKLKSLPEEMHNSLPSLVDLQIVDCSELEPFPEGCLPSKLKSLEIQNCKKLYAGRRQWGLQSLAYLSRFLFGMCEDAESFPESGLLPPTITYLEIGYCHNLKSLDKGMHFLTSLKKLTILNCPHLHSMPEEGLPESLSSLSICSCPLLEEKYQNENMQEWSKISHISCIKINYRKIN